MRPLHSPPAVVGCPAPPVQTADPPPQSSLCWQCASQNNASLLQNTTGCFTKFSSISLNRVYEIKLMQSYLVVFIFLGSTKKLRQRSIYLVLCVAQVNTKISGLFDTFLGCE